MTRDKVNTNNRSNGTGVEFCNKNDHQIIMQQPTMKETVSRGSCPPGLHLMTKLLSFRFKSASRRRSFHRWLVLVLTFIAYTSFHMGRRPLSVVKNVLNRNCSLPPATSTPAPIVEYRLMTETNKSLGTQPFTVSDEILIEPPRSLSADCSWAPFDDDSTADKLLAILDSVFLASYALSMFVSGFIGERMNLRHFVAIGSIGSGLGLLAFGLAKPLEIHSMTYFIVIQLVSGAFQSIGWPSVVTCVGNWFEPGKRGLIYGIWNSHTNLGNIVGATLAGYFVERDWALSFLVPAGIMVFVGILLYLFLAPEPADIGLANSSADDQDANSLNQTSTFSMGPAKVSSVTDDMGSGSRAHPSQDEDKQTQNKISSEQQKTSDDDQPISFWKAFTIPGVIEYSLCLFFSKLVNYTFLYWLPRYITASSAANSEESAYLSTPFDIGGAMGAILAGLLADRFNANALVCQLMLLLAIPVMISYEQFGTRSPMHNILIQLLVGSLVNGPYCLITTSVSADLGERIDGGRAMATVAAIIDGVGSLGAVVGPLVAGFITASGQWSDVFLMLILSGLISSLCLLRVTLSELRTKFTNNAKTYYFR